MIIQWYYLGLYRWMIPSSTSVKENTLEVEIFASTEQKSDFDGQLA